MKGDRQRWRFSSARWGAVLSVGVLLHSILAPSFVEANLWRERQQALQRVRSSNQSSFAASSSYLPPVQTSYSELFAQLPAANPSATHIDFGWPLPAGQSFSSRLSALPV